jgi:hypothetical protein
MSSQGSFAPFGEPASGRVEDNSIWGLLRLATGDPGLPAFPDLVRTVPVGVAFPGMRNLDGFLIPDRPAVRRTLVEDQSGGRGPTTEAAGMV